MLVNPIALALQTSQSVVNVSEISADGRVPATSTFDQHIHTFVFNVCSRSLVGRQQHQHRPEQRLHQGRPDTEVDHPDGRLPALRHRQERVPHDQGTRAWRTSSECHVDRYVSVVSWFFHAHFQCHGDR